MSQPVSGTEMPFATANEVITHVPWFGLTPRLPAIVGSDTLAIVVSSTCMKVPSASANAVTPRVPAGNSISDRSWLSAGPLIRRGCRARSSAR
jgi:hypothetical protein